MNRKTLFVTVAVLLLAAFAGAALLVRQHQSAQEAQRAAQHREALVRFHSPSVGSATAPVHIVEFLDPACETCRAFYPMVKQLMAEHPDKIRLSMRHVPFHKGADEVVKLIEASRKQGKYWETLEALLRTQPGWTRHHTAHVELAWAQLDGLGLDLERLKQDMQSPEIRRQVDQDLADARTLNVTKTPEFFVNGRPLPRFGIEPLRELVRQELAGR